MARRFFRTSFNDRDASTRGLIGRQSPFDTSRGFTIVELLIVIVVIGILAAITVVAYAGVMQQARNSDRLADIDAINKAIQMYEVNIGSYPRQGAVTAAGGMDTENFAVEVLRLPRSTIINPGGPTGTVNSISEGQYGSGMSENYYGYRAWTGVNETGSSCWATNHTCLSYRLWYRLEGSNAQYVRGSL